MEKKKLNLSALIGEEQKKETIQKDVIPTEQEGNNSKKDEKLTIKEEEKVKTEDEVETEEFGENKKENQKITLSHIQGKFTPRVEEKKEEKDEIVIEKKAVVQEEIFKNYESDFADISIAETKKKEKEVKKVDYRKRNRNKSILYIMIFIFLLLLGLFAIYKYTNFFKKEKLPVSKPIIETPIKKDEKPKEINEEIITKTFYGKKYEIIKRKNDDDFIYLYDNEEYETLEELEKILKRGGLIQRNLEIKNILIERYNKKKEEEKFPN